MGTLYKGKEGGGNRRRGEKSMYAKRVRDEWMVENAHPRRPCSKQSKATTHRPKPQPSPKRTYMRTYPHTHTYVQTGLCKTCFGIFRMLGNVAAEVHILKSRTACPECMIQNEERNGVRYDTLWNLKITLDLTLDFELRGADHLEHDCVSTILSLSIQKQSS